MKKIKYIAVAFAFTLMFFSCEMEYDSALNVIDTIDGAVELYSSNSMTVTETKTVSVTLRRQGPIYEDVEVHYTISGADFTAITGTTTFPKSIGAENENNYTFDVVLPANMVPAAVNKTDGTFTIDTCIVASGKVITSGLQGDNKTFPMVVNKYVPLDKTNLVGAFTENDGSDDYDVTITADPDNEFNLIISGGIWGGGSYKVFFNTIARETTIANQWIGLNYFDGSTTATADDAIWYYPASDGSTGAFDEATGVFTVMVNMIMPYYVYDFGDVVLTYTPQ